MKLFLLFCLFCTPLVAGEKFFVYVECESPSGFVNPDLADSVRDMEKSMKDRGYKITAFREKADIVIVVLGRAVGSEIVGNSTSVYRGLFGGLQATSTPIVYNGKYVFARMVIKDFSQDFWCSAPRWFDSTGCISKQIKKWTDQNAQKILSYRPTAQK